MVDARFLDLFALSRDVGRGWSALVRWRAALAQDPDGHADEEPLEPVRAVAGKSAWDELGRLAPSAAEVPLRDAVRRWVFALTQARVGRANEVELARLAAERRAPFFGDLPRWVSWREAWRALVGAKTAAEAALWLDAAAGAAPALAAALRDRAQRRVEVAHRMGLEHPWEGLVPLERAALRAIADRLLAKTDDLSSVVWKEALGGAAGAARVIHAAVARDAGEGWPARLGAQWLAAVFGAGPSGLPIELPALPAPVGAASFARALCTFGFAVRVATAPRAMPFALARAPAFVAAHRVGYAFGALAADPEWQERVLGVGRRAAAAQARSLARTALLEARLTAARILLGDDAALGPRDAFEEVGVRLFGAELDARFCGAWPAARDDEPARLIGLVEAHGFALGLRESFDTDWYRNPRAWAFLRAQGGAPALEPIDGGAMSDRIDALARSLEHALG